MSDNKHRRDSLVDRDLAYILTAVAELMDEKGLSRADALMELDRFVEQSAHSRRAEETVARLRRATQDREFRAMLGYEGLRAWGLRHGIQRLDFDIRQEKSLIW
jgi:hypothetical protein